MTTAVRALSGLCRPAISSGSLEFIKWFAALVMVLDHINKYILDARVEAMFNAGRLALPLFGFSLAYGLANASTGTAEKVVKRLLIAGVVSSVPYMAMGKLSGGWWPLNVLFMLTAAAVCIYMLEGASKAVIACAGVTFALTGCFVEFWWFGIAYVISAWWYCRKGGYAALLGWIACAALLSVVNGNAWALLALPVVLLAQSLDLRVPRLRHAFYLFYPLHLALIWLVR